MNAKLRKQDISYNLSGYFDAQTVSVLESDFQSLVDDSDGKLTLDLSNVDFMDSSGIGSIVFLYKRLKSQNIELILNGVNGQPARLIESLRVDKTITTKFMEEENV